MSEPKVPADKLCESCEGSGAFREDHGQGMVELLGCPDCEATGLKMCWDRHFCCDDREEHSHFLSSSQCPPCARIFAP